jgi:hypothetical protein
MSVSVDETEVLSQNRAFYAAFRQRDLMRMDDLWARKVEVACVHPGWQPIRGRPQVMASWRAILGQDNAPRIECSGATASILGETALVLCEELLDDGRLVATNLFVREEGEWRLCHHQAGPLAQQFASHPQAEQLDEEDGDEEDEDDGPSSPGRGGRLLN